jgi:hypothetical protein
METSALETSTATTACSTSSSSTIQERLGRRVFFADIDENGEYPPVGPASTSVNCVGESPSDGPDAPTMPLSASTDISGTVLCDNSRSRRRPLATVVCELPCREDYTEDMETLFFTRADYNLCRSYARTLSKDVERSGVSSKLLDATFNEKSKKLQDLLNQWTSDDTTGRRGLERWSSRAHGDSRQEQQFQAVMAVLRAQDDMLAKAGHHHTSSLNARAMAFGGSDPMCSADPRYAKTKIKTVAEKLDHEHLRKVSYKATKNARHYARMMGKADSFAVGSDLDSLLSTPRQKSKHSSRECDDRSIGDCASLGSDVHTHISGDSNDCFASKNSSNHSGNSSGGSTNHRRLSSGYDSVYSSSVSLTDDSCTTDGGKGATSDDFTELYKTDGISKTRYQRLFGFGRKGRSSKSKDSKDIDTVPQDVSTSRRSSNSSRQ